MAVPHCSEKVHLVIPPKKDTAEKRAIWNFRQVHLQHMQAICIQLLGMYLHLTVSIREKKQKMNPTTENMHGKIIQANQTSHCCIYLPVVFLFLQLIFTQSYFHYWQGYHILNKLRTDHLLYSAKGWEQAECLDHLLRQVPVCQVCWK